MRTRLQRSILKHGDVLPGIFITASAPVRVGCQTYKGHYLAYYSLPVINTRSEGPLAFLPSGGAVGLGVKSKKSIFNENTFLWNFKMNSRKWKSRLPFLYFWVFLLIEIVNTKLFSL